MAQLGTRYDHKYVEELVKSFWEREKIYEKAATRRRGKKFFFLDGPPYPSSPTFHPGTGWNKVIKDAVIRFWRLRGYNVIDTPGYDTHGLPIEVQVEKSLGVTNRRDVVEKIGIERFIKLCREFAMSNVEALSRGFKDLGIFMRWDRPYLTLSSEYIEEAWKLVKAAHDKGLLDTDLRVLHWCPRCGTVLADYEVTQEYTEIEDPSIYVKLPVRDAERTYLVIWTTTPWTLPANTFVMARGSATYVKVVIGGETLIFAENALERILREAGAWEHRVVERVSGRDLEGLEYDHPLEDLIPLQKILKPYHRVVVADEYVSLDEGSGLVHSAPGHGPEDFEVARRRGLPVYSPVDDLGRFTEEVGKYAGKAVREANREIVEDLRARGALLAHSRIVHRYPVCWRCKTPLILRATRQWIIRTSRLREKAVEAASKVEWIPRWGLERMRPLLENMQDWVISRQRFWGIPLPIWVCSSCGNRIVVGSVEELERLGGRMPEDLHRPWVDKVVLRCPRCGGRAERIPDVADVWLDSGVAFYASLGRGGLEIFKQSGPVDFVVEGHDQTRGWFFSMLRTGIVVLDRAPYSSVLVHGFVLDEKGREMHKSLGNYVEMSKVVDEFGRDAFRLFVLSNTTWEDLKFSFKRLEDSRRDLNIMWNVLLFARSYMDIDGYRYSEKHLEDLRPHMRLEDLWLLSKLASLVRTATSAVESYRIHEAANAIRDFAVEDLSRTYLKIVRRRVWEEENTPDKLAVYAVLFKALKTWSIMASTVIPHMAELIYQELVRRIDSSSEESVNLEEWPDPSEFEKYWDPQLEEALSLAKEVYEALAAARLSAGIKLRRPVELCIAATGDPRIAAAVEKTRAVLRELLNCQEIVTARPEEARPRVFKKIVRPNLAAIGREFRGLAKDVIAYIEQNPGDVARLVEKGGGGVRIGGAEVLLRPDHVQVYEEPSDEYSVSVRSWGFAAIKARVPEELVLAGFAREIIRRIQVMRKELGLSLTDYIVVDINSDEDSLAALERVKDTIARETRSRDLRLRRSPGEVGGDMVREWEIDGDIFIIGVSRIDGS